MIHNLTYIFSYKRKYFWNYLIYCYNCTIDFWFLPFLLGFELCCQCCLMQFIAARKIFHLMCRWFIIMTTKYWLCLLRMMINIWCLIWIICCCIYCICCIGRRRIGRQCNTFMMFFEIIIEWFKLFLTGWICSGNDTGKGKKFLTCNCLSKIEIRIIKNCILSWSMLKYEIIFVFILT